MQQLKSRLFSLHQTTKQGKKGVWWGRGREKGEGDGDGDRDKDVDIWL